MLIEFDAIKRDTTLLERGLDFADCNAVFAGPELTQLDSQCDYGEDRYITFGLLNACWGDRGLDFPRHRQFKNSPHYFHEVCQ